MLQKQLFSIFIEVEKIIVNAAIIDLVLFNMKINRQRDSFSCPCHATLALDGGERLTGHPSWFTPGDRTDHCPLTSRLGWARGRTGSSDDEELFIKFYFIFTTSL